ncbi:hypothetical protein [Nocardioides currus]|nr:hypothetical protein [Nocardioides currus]
MSQPTPAPPIPTDPGTPADPQPMPGPPTDPTNPATGALPA